MRGLGPEQRYWLISESAKQLKVLARNLDIPIIAAVQLNRDIEKRKEKTPTLADLRDSGELENNADAVFALTRDDRRNPRSGCSEKPAWSPCILVASLRWASVRGGRLRLMQFVAPYSLTGSKDVALHLHVAHLADLRASGLGDETIQSGGVYSLAPRDISHSFNLRRGVPKEIETALCFPLIVTEGEKKTLAAHQAGLNAVGIGGVRNWLSDGQPISELNLIEWTEREVTIIPHSDVFRRPDLLRAIYALGCELRAHGAQVLIAQIPQHTLAKIGLDDFIISGGNVDQLEVFSLSHRTFKGAAYWHSQWKFKKTIREAA